MGKIKKLKSNELVGGVDREDVYPITSTKAVFDDSNTSQDDINKNRLERIEDLEETMPTTVKSITINGGQRINTVDENGNVDLTIYSDGGQDYEGLTEVVADLRDIVGENPEEPQSGTLLERVDTLEDAVGTGGSVDQRIENAINSLDSQIVVNYGDANPHIRGAVQLVDGKLTRFELEESDIASANALQALDDYTHSIYQTKIEAVSTRPATGEAGIIYRVPNSGGTTYKDWMYSGGWKELATFNIATLNASDVNYDNSQSGLAADNVQGALDDVASATKEIQERMTNELSIPIGSYPSCGGFINGNSFVRTPKYYGILVPFSEYVGKTIRFKKRESASFLRYAFLTQPLVSGQTVSFCSGETVKTISKDSIDVTVPSDCNYVYIYVYSDGANFRPTLFELQDVDIKELDNDVITLNEKVGDEELDYLILKSVKGSEIPSSGGFVNTDGTFKTNDSRYYGGFIDVSEYRGKKVKITAGSWGQYRYAFCKTIPTSATSTSILCSGCSLMTTNSQASIVIPNDCNGLYIYLYANGTNNRPESVVIHEDTSITTLLNYVYEKIDGEEPSTEGDEMDMGEYNPSIAEIFNYYFAALTQEQQSTLLGLDSATITQNGLTLPSMSFITHNKLTAFSDEKITLELTASTLDKILMYASTNGALSTSETASYILFDFANGRVSIFRAGTMTSSGQGTELCGVDFNSASGDYILTIGRRRRNVFASIYNKSTRILNEIVAEETLYPSVNTAKRPAGWMYKEPSFMTIAGTPIYKRFSCNVKGSLFMMFQGDSYTEGYAGFYPNCWAYKAARYFKNSRTCGLSGHKLADMITQYHDSIKGKINVSVMVISIGINDMSDLTSDAKIATWANTYKGYLDELVEDGIIPIVNRIWPEGSNDSATSTKAKKMNDYIRSWGFDGADFGAVNGYTSNSTYYTSGHLTAAGNDLTYQIFINELSKYKNN